MSKLKAAILMSASMLLSITTQAQVPNYIDRHESATEDTNAIMQVTRDFQSAIINKNPKQLSALLLNSNILFASPVPPQKKPEGSESIFPF